MNFSSFINDTISFYLKVLATISGESISFTVSELICGLITLIILLILMLIFWKKLSSLIKRNNRISKGANDDDDDYFNLF